MSFRLKYYRIVEERADDDSYVEYRVQKRGLFGWKDVRVIFAGSNGIACTRILRFQVLENAREWINSQRARTECKKTVLETYAVYG